MPRNARDQCFTREWIERQRVGIKADPILLEKAIYCLELASQLCMAGLDFLLKGGTTVYLLLPQIRRLSIDVDVATSSSREQIERVLEAIVTEGLFTGYEEAIRVGERHERIPKLHYEITFEPRTPQRRGYILLDVILEEPGYTTQMATIRAPFYEPTQEVQVRIPTANSALGDKLVALAPDTTGIPFGVNKELPRIKQLYDVGMLFQEADDLEEIADAFARSVEQESRFLRAGYGVDSVVADLVNLARLTTMIDLRGAREEARTQEIRRGVNALKSHLIGGRRYNLIPEAKADVALAAFCAGLIQRVSRGGEVSSLLTKVRTVAEGDPGALPELVRRARLPEGFDFVQRLSRQSPKAAVYWCGSFDPALFGDI
ncbi:MAG: hypothetical protein CVU38_16360 [Chloroflexi bacterium HGW-Chloroflexi-1]|nr:MAG: hypothetical protein CVU38_16360 [Chloroflexi bacterium HGW-Chloroflexi-1]